MSGAGSASLLVDVFKLTVGVEFAVGIIVHAAGAYTIGVVLEGSNLREAVALVVNALLD
jgi:hypothetical protein